MKTPNISTLVLIALALGLVTGIFFGEMVGFLAVVGDIYVRLLQMTVLPYVFVSLVAGLGSLTYQQAGRIARNAGLVLLLMWGIGFATIFLAMLAYPKWQAAAFFSTTLVQTASDIDFLELYIPANVFYSFTNTIVPAIVLFSLALGGALISVKEKRALVEILNTVSEALMKITHFVVWVAPIGIFAITASAAGTLQAEEFGRLQVFIWVSAVVWILLLLWTLPLLVAAFTPAKYRSLLRESRDALVTAFATGSLLIVIPLMSEAIKNIVRSDMQDSEEAEAMVDVLVPTAYNFPTAGMIMIISFIPFAAWFHGSPFSLLEFSKFATMGIFSAFGGSNIALPYLLNAFALPTDLFQLYLVAGVLVGRMAISVSAMHIIVLSVLSVALIYGGVRLSAKRVGIFAVLSVTLTAVSLAGVGAIFTNFVEHKYTQDQMLIRMHLLADPVDTVVDDELPDPLSAEELSRSRIDVIVDRGTIRVGYLADRLPFAFRNTSSEVVGLDIAMAHEFARDLDLTLEIVRLEDMSLAAAAVNSGQIDIIMSGTTMTPALSEDFTVTAPHIEQTFAFVVQDHRRAEFSTAASILAKPNLRIASQNVPYYRDRIQEGLPNAELVPIESPREFFRGEADVDAMAFTAEAGSAWSLIYPDFSVAVPQPVLVRIPMTYLLPKGDLDFRLLVGDWLELKRGDGTLDDLYDQWILGKTATSVEPRWSIIRNVLHWVD